MAAKKTNDGIKLSDDLQKVVDGLVAGASPSGVTEDDIQLAIKDVDVDSDELSDLYDELRSRGVEVSSS